VAWKFNPFTGKLDKVQTAASAAWGFFDSPVESPDGARTEFTLPNSDTYVAGFIVGFVDGSKQAVTETSSTTVTFAFAPLSTETVELFYLKA